MRPGPSTLDGLRRLSEVLVKRVFKGPEGELRQRRAFALLEPGVVINEDFAGRQGAAIAVHTAMIDMQIFGLETEGAVIWRSTEKSPGKRRRLESGNLKPIHSYENVKDVMLSAADLEFIAKTRPDPAAYPALCHPLAVKERIVYHDQLKKYFKSNEERYSHCSS